MIAIKSELVCFPHITHSVKFKITGHGIFSIMEVRQNVHLSFASFQNLPALNEIQIQRENNSKFPQNFAIGNYFGNSIASASL